MPTSPASHAAPQAAYSTVAHDEGQRRKDADATVRDTILYRNQPPGMADANPNTGTPCTMSFDSSPRAVDIYQIFEQANNSIKRLEDYAKALESSRPLPADYRIIQVTDAHGIIRAAGALIDVVEIRYHIDSPRWWSRGWRFYKKIKNHCRRARELENDMRIEDNSDFRKELAERGSTKVSIMPLTADQAEEISAKFRELLDETKSAAALFGEYRKATKPVTDRRQALIEDLDEIEKQVIAAVKVIDSATSAVSANLSRPVIFHFKSPSLERTGS